jgi:RHS repeat-associated protein
LEYGGDTQRVLKNYTSGGSTNSKLYLHGQNDYPLIEKNKTSATAETLAVYVYGLNGVIAKRVGSTVLFLLKDHLGSTRVVMDATGLVRTYYDYDALGNLIRTGTVNEVKYQFTGQELDESSLHNYRARLYDSDLGKFYAIDPAGQRWSPFVYAGNNPVIMVDRDGNWFFSAFLGPVGAVIDAALWSATFDAAVQGTKIALGAQKEFNFAELGGAFAGAAIGSGLGLIAPSFSGSPLALKYAGKAVYAGFTGALSTAGGLFTQDLLENGRIDYDDNDYLNAIKWGGGIAAGVSLGYSAYDYITWDRFSPQQRLDIVNREFHSNIQYDPNLTGSYASTNIRTLNVRFGDAALENKAIARNTALHELRHVADIQAIRAGTLQISGNPRLFLEARGHLADITAVSQHNLPSRYFFESVRGLRSYGYAGSIPKALRWKNIWFNLFR